MSLNKHYQLQAFHFGNCWEATLAISLETYSGYPKGPHASIHRDLFIRVSDSKSPLHIRQQHNCDTIEFIKFVEITVLAIPESSWNI
jgi:hypothetical protein